MKRFLITYWLSVGLLFAIFYWELSPVSFFLNSGQTDFTSFLTSLTLPSMMMGNHHIFISSNYQLVIEKACNGMVPYLFFLAPIIVFPSTLIHKVKWAILGYLFIIIVNVFRIWFITQLVLQERSYFSLAHDYLGNILLILTSLMLFILFVKTRSKEVDYQ